MSLWGEDEVPRLVRWPRVARKPVLMELRVDKQVSLLTIPEEVPIVGQEMPLDGLEAMKERKQYTDRCAKIF